MYKHNVTFLIALEFVEDADHVVGLFQGHGWMTGKAQFLLVNLFGDRKREAVPSGIALLLVWGDGVMNHGLYATSGEIVLKFVTVRRQHWEDVIDTL